MVGDIEDVVLEDEKANLSSYWLYLLLMCWVA